MPLYYIQAGTSLQKMGTGGVLTTLTLPSGVTLSTRRGRWGILNRLVVFANAGSVNLFIDPADDTVRVMVPRQPASPAITATGAAGDLTGAYTVKYSYAIKNSNGVVISEGPLSLASNSTTLTSQNLNVTGIVISPDTDVNTRRLYRTTAGGSVYFHWVDLDNNTDTSVEDDLTDAALSLLPAPALGAPPGTTPGGFRLGLVTAWKGRLYGVAAGTGADLDSLLWTELRKLYAWPATNALPIPPVGGDLFGITGIIPRRDLLGIGKRDSLHAITSPTPLEGTRRTVAPGVGITSHESIVVEDDIAWWLGEDGVYQWDDSGVRNVSEAKVHPWFATDDTFARSQFGNAVGMWHNGLRCYRLFLAPAGGTDLTRFVDYYPQRQMWLGPHLTGGFTPTYGYVLETANDIALPIIASSSGFVFQDQATRTDGASTAIDFDVTEQFHSAGTPTIEKHWGQLAVASTVETAGTLTVTPTVGGLDASAGAAISHSLTTGYETLRRLSAPGGGRFMRLRFRENTAGQDCTLYGYDVNYHELGQR